MEPKIYNCYHLRSPLDHILGQLDPISNTAVMVELLPTSFNLVSNWREAGGDGH
jgi:hypothetical protein